MLWIKIYGLTTLQISLINEICWKITHAHVIWLLERLELHSSNTIARKQTQKVRKSSSEWNHWNVLTFCHCFAVLSAWWISKTKWMAAMHKCLHLLNILELKRNRNYLCLVECSHKRSVGYVTMPLLLMESADLWNYSE